jgi:hypothetical protein
MLARKHNDWQVKPLDLDKSTCRAVARGCLQRVLGSLDVAMRFGAGDMYRQVNMRVLQHIVSGTVDCSALAVRMAMSMACTDVTASVRVMAPNTRDNTMWKPLEGLGKEKNWYLVEYELPQTLVDLVDFVTDTAAKNDDADQGVTLSGPGTVALELLLRFFVHLYNAEGLDTDTTLYDRLVAYTINKLRGMPSVSVDTSLSLLARLPSLPKATVFLLQMSAQSQEKRLREWGLRLLRDMVFEMSPDIWAQCLQVLLWCAVSGEFELRVKCVQCLVNELWEEERIQPQIMTFALHALVAIVSPELLQWRATTASEHVLVRTQAMPTAQTDPTEQKGMQLVDPERTEDQELQVEPTDGVAALDDADAVANTGTGAVLAAESGAVNGVVEDSSLYGVMGLQSYDGGKCFGGTFHLPQADGTPSRATTPQQITRLIQLIVSITVRNPVLVMALRDSYGTVAAAAQEFDSPADPAAARVVVKTESDIWNKDKVPDRENFLAFSETLMNIVSKEVQASNLNLKLISCDSSACTTEHRSGDCQGARACRVVSRAVGRRPLCWTFAAGCCKNHGI